jgi:multimeric flavodoxin WrbA
MKVVAVLGSPHGMKGNTGAVLASLLKGAEDAGAEATTYSLADLNVAPCRGCDVCHKTGRCAIQDDFPRLLGAMLEADALVLASPNYIFSVSAQLKALLDRCCGPLHLQEFQDQYAAAVVTSGGAGGDEVERYLLRFLRSLGCWTVGSVGTEALRLFDDTMRAEVLQSAEKLGAQLVAAARDQLPMPDQQVEREAFYQRMKDLMARQRERWPYEYEYWRARGRL